ncbi:MAG: acetate--CoA ligase alpha subunit [Planctomycetota bacterium]
MLDNFFLPRSVAVIGASREKGKVGHDILKNLVESSYTGKIFPINPKAREILGLETYASALETPDDIDLAVVVIPPKFVLPTLDEMGKKRVPAAIIITAGFKESGVEGGALEREVARKCKAHGIRVMGPNCLGLINTAIGLNASFAPATPSRGNIAFFSQSGALCTAILDWALGADIGFSKFVSLGNKMDVDEVDLLRSLADDKETEVILGYVEGVKDGVEFMRVAEAVSRKKPIIIAKSGGTAAGAKAASSHTGSLAGSETAFTAAFRQSGIIRAKSIQDLFDYALGFAYQGAPKGPRVSLITNAGGPGIIAADAVERSGLRMAELQKETIDKLRGGLPPTAALYNPVDVIGDAKADRYEIALRAVLEDEHVDCVVVILTPQAMTEVEETARVVARLAAETEKPVVTTFIGGPTMDKAEKVLNEAHVPNYAFPENAVSALDASYRYCQWRSMPRTKPQPLEANQGKVADFLAAARQTKRFELGESDAREIIAAYGFRVPKSIIAGTREEAVAAAKEVGYPLVMKIASPDILHKSDIGGVRVGVADDEEVVRTFGQMYENARHRMPEAEIYGIAMQEMIRGGKEVILGMKRDSQFGPMLMFGLGGIYVEVLKDVSFRIAPITVEDAEDMIREIRSYALLRGVRGEQPADLAAVRESLLRLSQLVTSNPQIIELDINPLVVFAEGEGAIAIDARLTIEGE